MKYLILVDVQYPYSVGETFLENEIREIAPRFDQVLIFPADLVTGEKQTRSIPDNVRACLFETENPTFRKAKAALRALPRVPANHGSLKTRFWDAYFEAAAKDQAKKIIRILEEYTFSSEDEVTLYSYWLYIPARIVVELKHWFLGKGVPVRAVSRAHGFDIHEKYSGKNYLPQRQLLLRELDRVYACSKDGAACLRRKFSAYGEKIGVSLLGTYDHGIGKESHRPFHLVSCSRLVELKRVDMIAEAMVSLISKGYLSYYTNDIARVYHMEGDDHLSEFTPRKKTLQSCRNTMWEAMTMLNSWDVYGNRKNRSYFQSVLTYCLMEQVLRQADRDGRPYRKDWRLTRIKDRCIRILFWIPASATACIYRSKKL